MNFVEKYQGTGVALVTPFQQNKEIDFHALERLINHVVNGGVEYLVVQGTTGESVTVSKEEKREILNCVIQTNASRRLVVYGFGSNNTRELVKDIEKFNFEGVEAILSVCPYYNKPSQEGIFEHFKAVSNASPVPVIIYNVPGRTVVNINPETTIRLAEECPNIIGIKEATDNIDQVMKLVRRKPANFAAVGGDDALALPLISCGLTGVISVLSNAFPAEFSEMVRQTLAGNMVKARNLHYGLIDIMETLLTMNNPAGIKAVLNILGIIDNNLRLPLMPVSKEQYQKLEPLVKNFINN